MRSLNPETILYAFLKPSGDEAVLLRRLGQNGVPRLEITVARATPEGGLTAVRSIGIGLDMLDAFRDGVVSAAAAVQASREAAEPTDGVALRRSRRHRDH